MADLVRLAERIALILMSGFVVWRWLPQFGPHPQVILVLASELFAVFFLLIQRKGSWATSAYTTAIAFGGTAASLCVVPGGISLAPDFITAPIVTLGTGIALVAKLSLRRSFGLVPANRGVKISGAYRFVRHPMYTGYVLNHLGFLMLFFSAWNLAVYLTCWILLYLRVVEEERFLLKDPQYVDYTKSVTSRVIPGLI
jgi:protein-S-isoprenylcysteine O-methyltransferase Ste14